MVWRSHPRRAPPPFSGVTHACRCQVSSATGSGWDGRSDSRIDLVESVYGCLAEVTTTEWLRRTLVAFHTLSPAAVAAYAYGYDLDGSPDQWRISRPIVHGMPEAFAESIYNSFLASPPPVRRAPPTGRVGHPERSDQASSQRPTARRRSGGAGARRDGRRSTSTRPIRARAGSSSLAIPTSTRLSLAERRRFAMIAAHVAAAAPPPRGRHWRTAVGRVRSGGRVAHAEATTKRRSRP